MCNNIKSIKSIVRHFHGIKLIRQSYECLDRYSSEKKFIKFSALIINVGM